MWSLHWLLLAWSGSLAAPPRLPSRPQPSTVVIRVVDELSKRGLTNADVTDLATGQHRLTDERGEARLAWPDNGQLRLRVREIGYSPVERTLHQTARDDPSIFELKRVAYVITPVKATSHCASEADSASLELSVAVLEQLRQGAEKYDQFRKTYPFEATVERRSALIPSRGDVKRIVSRKEKYSSDNWEFGYRPGAIVEYEGGTPTVPILFLSTLGNSLFWDHHCFIVRGIESYGGRRVVRLEFSPSADTRGPDWKGTALMDSASSYLLRVDFEIANLDLHSTPSHMLGYTTFRSPSPFVVMPDTTVAIWWRQTDSRAPDLDRPDYAESLYIGELKYKKQTPPP
ncbi:MAG: hypothetical protein ABR585_10955 [Gemmatimonadaceae bacterium]